VDHVLALTRVHLGVWQPVESTPFDLLFYPVTMAFMAWWVGVADSVPCTVHAGHATIPVNGRARAFV
jgi:hypothetical protein